jgi:hypothetical protein
MSTREPVSREQCWAEFAAIGEDRTRALVATGQCEPRKKAFAEEWLRHKREERANAASRPVPKHHEPPTLKLSSPPKVDFIVVLAAAAIVLVMVASVVMSIW